MLVSLHIKTMKGINCSFSFQTVAKESTGKLTTDLDNKKTVQSIDIPAKLIKEFCCLFSSFTASNISKCINEGTNVDALKKSRSSTTL